MLGTKTTLNETRVDNSYFGHGRQEMIVYTGEIFIEQIEKLLESVKTERFEDGTK